MSDGADSTGEVASFAGLVLRRLQDLDEEEYVTVLDLKRIFGEALEQYSRAEVKDGV